jgi:antirestriction protein
MKTPNTTPKIYVACLAAYNNGKLHGVWIDATQDADAIHEEIQAMLKNSPEPFAEEWAIHDYEGFEGLKLSEYESIDDVIRYAHLIKEYGQAYAAYANDIGSDYASEEAFQEAYQGEWESEEDFAREIAQECFEIPENIEMYFDYQAFARDLFISDYYSIQDDEYKIHVFRRM